MNKEQLFKPFRKPSVWSGLCRRFWAMTSFFISEKRSAQVQLSKMFLFKNSLRNLPCGSWFAAN
jgi:hypothetical protein